MSENDYQIFVSYAKPDHSAALEIYEWLETQGLNPWMDSEKLKPGQNWDFELQKALERSTFIIAIISRNSVDRRGYVQREIAAALDRKKERLEDDIFIIPIVIDDLEGIPERFKSIQVVRTSDPRFKKLLLESITLQIERLGGERKETQEQQELFWSSKTRKESWEGIPGYEFECQFFEFWSKRYSNVEDIGTFVRGHFLGELLRHRSVKLQQDANFFNFAQDKWARTNTFSAFCAEPTIRGSVLNLVYNVDWYGAGAAHPNHHHETFSFVLEPMVYIQRLMSIFGDDNDEKALQIIRDESYRQIRETLLAHGREEDEWLIDTIKSGTENWDSFHSFSFGDEGIDLYFPPYQVASYADGLHTAKIPYAMVAKLVTREYRTALQIEYFARG
ncbi:TIR domain-containing protein [Mesorhizobium sp. B2-8-5]|uniref:TIR domain-containing protein n=1 Tax=Mesorhizobium sp. B2-8-5 TaxID=2589903 RepID=UPI00112BD2F6|nr:TIR domain-containing protein [Mesorhizobium sp. B2-8-5]UCI23997.1 TIR domain-containing protein [Mesorhizobium sp. B2-8-5]